MTLLDFGDLPESLEEALFCEESLAALVVDRSGADAICFTSGSELPAASSLLSADLSVLSVVDLLSFLSAGLQPSGDQSSPIATSPHSAKHF
jgi:hypothetical protein